jgi:hypothetical protein
MASLSLDLKANLEVVGALEKLVEELSLEVMVFQDQGNIPSKRLR